MISQFFAHIHVENAARLSLSEKTHKPRSLIERLFITLYLIKINSDRLSVAFQVDISLEF